MGVLLSQAIYLNVRVIQYKYKTKLDPRLDDSNILYTYLPLLPFPHFVVLQSGTEMELIEIISHDSAQNSP